jgi:hypothetical protein
LQGSENGRVVTIVRAQIGKNYARCNSHYPIMDHAKIKNNIPASSDKWIYE